MRVLILLLALTSCHAQAGSTEYWLLDTTDCKRYLVSTDLGVYYDPDPVKYQKAQARYDQTIGTLKATHDDTWSAGWGVEVKGGERSFGVCKEEYDSPGNKLALFQCDGDAQYPLPELRCIVGSRKSMVRKVYG